MAYVTLALPPSLRTPSIRRVSTLAKIGIEQECEESHADDQEDEAGNSGRRWLRLRQFDPCVRLRLVFGHGGEHVTNRPRRIGGRGGAGF